MDEKRKGELATEWKVSAETVTTVITRLEAVTGVGAAMARRILAKLSEE